MFCHLSYHSCRVPLLLVIYFSVVSCQDFAPRVFSVSGPGPGRGDERGKVTPGEINPQPGDGGTARKGRMICAVCARSARSVRTKAPIRCRYRSCPKEFTISASFRIFRLSLFLLKRDFLQTFLILANLSLEQWKSEWKCWLSLSLATRTGSRQHRVQGVSQIDFINRTQSFFCRAPSDGPPWFKESKGPRISFKVKDWSCGQTENEREKEISENHWNKGLKKKKIGLNEN